MYKMTAVVSEAAPIKTCCALLVWFYSSITLIKLPCFIFPDRLTSPPTTRLKPWLQLKGTLDTQGPVIIKSKVWRLLSPAALLSTADAPRGWPILHYGLSEKGSIAASRASQVCPASDFSVRHQSQRKTEDPERKKAEQQSFREKRGCCRVLIGATGRIWDEMHCRMINPASESDAEGLPASLHSVPTTQRISMRHQNFDKVEETGELPNILI